MDRGVTSVTQGDSTMICTDRNRESIEAVEQREGDVIKTSRP